jgi:hypothetical protein
MVLTDAFACAYGAESCCGVQRGAGLVLEEVAGLDGPDAGRFRRLDQSFQERSADAATARVRMDVVSWTTWRSIGEFRPLRADAETYVKVAGRWTYLYHWLRLEEGNSQGLKRTLATRLPAITCSPLSANASRSGASP